MGPKVTLCSFMQILYLTVSLIVVRASPVCVLGGFESQAEVVLQHVSLPSTHLRDMSRVVVDVQRVLQKLWPGTSVVEFGASTTGLALMGSDVDCFVFVPNRTKIRDDDATLISKIRTQLIQHLDLFKNMHMKPNLDVPVLSFDHVPTEIPVDLTVTSPLIVRDANLLAKLLRLDKKILDMAIIVKYWSYIHDISGDEYVLPSYTVTLLVIFYLQQINILPSIAALQEKATPEIVDHWNTAFTLPENLVVNESLYQLLGGFFNYYSNFQFDDVISPYCGCVIKREQFEKMQLPKVFSDYENNLKLGFADPFIFGPVNTQDIFEQDLNTGRPWNNRSMVDNLKVQMKFAADMYEKMSSDRFLLTILQPHKYMDRDFLNKLWASERGLTRSCLG